MIRLRLRPDIGLSTPPYFKNEREAVSLANASKYGLGAGIWTSDLSRAHRVAGDIESGLVWVNTHHRNDPSSPWSVAMSPLYDADILIALLSGEE